MKLFFREYLGIQEIEFHPLNTKPPISYSFSQLEIDVLRLLYESPRMPSHTVATKICRSSKAVRMAINRLQLQGIAHFSIQPIFQSYFLKIRARNNQSISQIRNQIYEELPFVWKISQSSSEPVYLMMFLPTKISDISIIRKWFGNNVMFDLEYEGVCEPLKYYPSIRTEYFVNLL